MLNKYIQELIENNNRIIIPDFGAFMIQDTPEGKQISFNDFLKFNDGLLINQIIKAEKISKNQASDKIKEFVKQINEAFSKKESFEVEGVGFLNKDANGNIKFSASKAPKKEAEVSPTDEKPTIVLDEKKKEEKKPAAKAEEKKPEPKATPKTAPKAAPKAKEAVAKKAPAAKTTSTDKKPMDKKPTPTASKQEAPKKTFEKKYAIPENESNNKLMNTLIVVFLVIIIGGGGYWAISYFDLFKKKEKPAVVEQVQEPVVPAVDSSAMVTDTIIEEPRVVEEPVETIDPNQKYYYLVAGSFKVASNADNFNQKLINEGYDSEIVIRNNGFHTVSYNTFTEWNAALSAWKSMRNTDEQTWILVQRGK